MSRLKKLILSFAVFATLVAAGTAQAAQPLYTWIYVGDMHCQNCANRISRKLYTVPGVVKVQTSLEKNFAVVTPQQGKALSPRSLWEAVEKAEFTPVKLQGPSGVFTQKPAR